MSTEVMSLILAIAIPSIAGVLGMFAKSLGSKMSKETADAKFDALKQEIVLLRAEQADHQSDDRAFQARIETKFGNLDKALADLPERIFERLRQPQIPT